MQAIQNSQECHQNNAKIGKPQQQQHVEARQRSIPKFNRKSPSIIGQKKKKNESCVQNEPHRIVYISPAKNINNCKQITHLSPTLSDVMNRFSISNEELFDFKPKQHSNSNHLQTCNSETCNRIKAIKKKEIKNLNEKLEKEKDQNRRLHQTNKELKTKLSDLQYIQIFLLQRESFISEILQSNIRLNENIQKTQKQKLSMAEHFGVLLQQKLDCERQYQRQYIQWSNILQEKNQQITRLLALATKIQPSFHKTKSSKPQLFLTSKENIPITTDEYQNKPNRKCHVQVQFNSHDPNIASPRKVGETSEKQWAKQRQRLERMIKQLQERIKYGNIQMDILRKQKEDSSKLNTNNQTLKKQNRKLLNRLDYLTRTFSRNSNNSDSSLELSLSPRH